jgi:LuxR family maltose regulon positive regulatory protein
MDHARPQLPFRPLEWKLRPPVPALPLVRRHGLLETLRSSQEPLVLVSAEAGAGKTTLFIQWTKDLALPTAWLQLDQAEDDPLRFTTYLTAALESAITLDPSLQELLSLPVPMLEEVVAPALADSVARASPFLLVVDDAHQVQNETCWRVLHTLGASLPRGARIAIGTRGRPPLPVEHLRTRGLLLLLTFEDLALDRAEMAEMLRLHGLVSSEQDIEALVASTEGWATGVYLATMSPRTRGGDGPAADLRAGGREVDSYFASEIFDRQPEDRQDFLLRTSILRRLTPPLCQVVTGSDGAATMLRRLADDNLFVSELGDDGTWFRYHHLFAAFLETELARRAPTELPGLHRRAAAWYGEADIIERALHHLLAAGAVDEAAETVAANFMPFVLEGQLATAASWLEPFSDEQILGHPALALVAGWVHAFSGDARTGALWRRAEALEVVDGPSPDGAASLRSSRALLRATLAEEGVEQMLRDAELAASLETDPRSAWYATAHLLLGSALFAAGRPDDAIVPLLVAFEVSTAKYVLTEMGAAGMLALIAADNEDWESVRRYVDHAAACLTDTRMGAFCPSAVVHVARARVLAHDGDPGVGHELARARAVLDDMVTWPCTTLLVSVVAGELCLRHDWSAEAEIWLAFAQATLKTWPSAGALGRRTDDLRAAVGCRLGSQPLTLAEQRVLQLLPSQLSLAEIAEQLGLSANTVKTHVQHIHAKLGVSTRTPAVERARQLGLLDH